MSKRTLLLALPAVLALAMGAAGQELQGRNVTSIELQGLERISEQVVRSQIETQVGQEYNPRAVSRDIRRLYESNYFATVRVDAQPADGGVALTYIVEEKRVIADIRIIGNDKVKTRNIREVITWRTGDSFVPATYDQEREAILGLYETKGFPNASVDISVEEIGPSRVRVTYVIDEGGKARIKEVNFVGNEVLTERQLRKLVKTKRSWWFLGGKYDAATFETDLNNIINEYGNYGRLEAQITKTEFEYAPEGKGLTINVYLAEGPEYTVESLEVAQNEVFDDDEVVGLLEVQAGDVHNKGQVEQDAQLVAKGYQDSGYLNADVVPQVTLDRDKKTTHIVHRVVENDLKYVRQIDITGNRTTRDDVIRRDVYLAPGDRYDGSKLRASERKLEATEYFEDIRVNVSDVEDNELFSDIYLDVEEGKTGFFNFGFGWSTEEQFGGFGELRLNNFDITNWPTFSGGGQQFRMRVHVSDLRTQYSLGFTDPQFAGYPIAVGFDVFDETYDYDEGSSYSESSQGGQLRFGKSLSPYVTARMALRYRDAEIDNIGRSLQLLIERERGGETTISNIWGINRNTYDSRRDTSSGSEHDLEFELAGLGGDNEFYKIQHDSQWFWPLDNERKWILSYHTRQGWANEYGSSDFVPIFDRFFAGGTATVRGYDHRDIGPKECSLFGEGNAIGGDLRVLNSIELKYKLTDQVRFYTFVDSGGVWWEANDFDLGDIKYSAGLGFGVEIPRMGPIRLDYGIPINPDDDQGNGRFHLLTGFRF